MIKETIAYHKDYSISCSRKNPRQLFYSNGEIISLDCAYSNDESDLIFRTKSGEKYEWKTKYVNAYNVIQFGMPGNMSGDQGQAPVYFGGNRTQQPGDQRQLPGNDPGSQIQIPGVNGNNEQMPGGRQNGGFPGQNSENAGEVPTPPEMNAGEGSSTATPGENADAPQIPGGNAPAIPSENGNAPQRPEMNGNVNVPTPPDQDNGESVPEIPQDGERPSLPEEARDGVAEPNETEFVPAESAESTNWFIALINAIRNFFRSLFGR